METHNIIVSDNKAIIIGERGINEITQNIRMILTTIRGTLYLDRDFGLDPELIDTPQINAIIKYRSEIIDQIEKYEPRVNVIAIDFTTNQIDAMNGTLSPVVKFEIKPGVLL